MIKKITLFLPTLIVFILASLVSPQSSSALEVEFIGPCSKIPLLSVRTSWEDNSEASSIGEITELILKKNQTPYIGSEQGLRSLFETPYGLDAMELLSDTTLRAHGWCYEVDGIIPEKLAHQFSLNKNLRKIRWFFGYSTNYKNEWFGYCEPSYKVAPSQFCD